MSPSVPSEQPDAPEAVTAEMCIEAIKERVPSANEIILYSNLSGNIQVRKRDDEWKQLSRISFLYVVHAERLYELSCGNVRIELLLQLSAPTLPDLLAKIREAADA